MPSKRFRHRSLRKRRFNKVLPGLPEPSKTIRFWKIRPIGRLAFLEAPASAIGPNLNFRMRRNTGLGLPLDRLKPD
jgi:hypothetical protein